MNKETINPENIEVIDPVTIPISEAELKEIQIDRFKSALNGILPVKTNPAIKFSEYLLRSVNVIYPIGLRGFQLLHLFHLATSWNMELFVSSSRAGLSINFTLKTT